MKSKVFCIGFHKTGTTSLGNALKTLGYKVTGPNGVNDPDISKNVYAIADSLIHEYDAFQDNPWPIIYKYLDEKYPNSKFILTLRDSNSWIKSQVRHFGPRETPMRKWIYGVGCPEGNEDIYKKRFEKHNREVMDHFKGRNDDLLTLNFPEGDGWEKLCSFLEAPLPDIPFPHSGRAIDREKRKKPHRRFFRQIRKSLNGIFGNT